MQGAGMLDASVNSIRSRARLSETSGTWIVNDDDAQRGGARHLLDAAGDQPPAIETSLAKERGRTPA